MLFRGRARQEVRAKAGETKHVRARYAEGISQYMPSSVKLYRRRSSGKKGSSASSPEVHVSLRLRNELHSGFLSHDPLPVIPLEQAWLVVQVAERVSLFIVLSHAITLTHLKLNTAYAVD